MRYFFGLLIFLLCSFGLTFSVLLSTPDSTHKHAVLGIVDNKVIIDEGADDEQVFRNFEVCVGWSAAGLGGGYRG
jgi:hypothetical protein